MGQTKAGLKWSDVKKQLQQRTQPELLELLHDLFKLSLENQLCLAARLLGGTASTSLLEPYRKRIEQAFYKRSGWPQDKLQLVAARKAIRDYQKATGDSSGTVELMLTYFETGTAFTRSFGDIDAPFYNSLSSVLDEIRQLLTSKEGQGLYGQFRERLLELVDRADPIGWGYGDDVRNTVAALEHRWEKGQQI